VKQDSTKRGQYFLKIQQVLVLILHWTLTTVEQKKYGSLPELENQELTKKKQQQQTDR
jgi:hypothetical protein